METVTRKLNVPEMHCGHCVAAVSGALEGLPLVARDIDLTTRSVQVTFDPSQTTLGQVVEAIEDQGYDVEAPEEG